MTFKYIILILSIVVLVFVFYKQYEVGRSHSGVFTEEPMTGQGGCSSQEEPTPPPSCTNDYSESKSLPLREYCVKASFNSAYDGNDVSGSTLVTRIKEGYRFIDLNVFPAADNVYVGFSPDNTPAAGATSVSNKLLLSEALDLISKNAFSRSPDSNTNLPNMESYPLFVHIRVYRDTTATTDIIKMVAKTLNGTIGSPTSYSGNYMRETGGSPTQIDGCTPLSSIMGKIIFSMDILNILQIYSPSDYQSARVVPPDTINELQKFVNILTGGSTFPAFYRYTDDSLIYRTNTLGVSNIALNGSLQTNVKHMYISFPHPDDVPKDASRPKLTGVIQPDIQSFILSRSIQFTPLRAYLTGDPNLNTYVTMFDTIKTPFVPMFYVYGYLNGSLPTPTTAAP